MTDKEKGVSTFEENKSALIRLFANAHDGSLDNMLRAAAAIAGFKDELEIPVLDGSILDVVNSCRDARKWTCLHFGAAGDNAPVVKAIIDVNPNLVLSTEEDGLTPLMVATRHVNLEICRMLLSSQISESIRKEMVNKTCKSDGRTALHYSIHAGNIELVKILVEAGADVNANSHSFGTPLCCAVMDGLLDLIGVLLQYKSDINLTSGDIPPPLVLASSLRQTNVVKLLLDSKQCQCDVNIKDSKGWTALQCTAESGDLEIAKMLISEGADLHYTNENQNALDLATINDHPAIVEYLASLGGKRSMSNHRIETEKMSEHKVADDVKTIELGLSEEEDKEKIEGIWKNVNTWPSKSRRRANTLKLEGNRKVDMNDFDGALKCYIDGLSCCYPCKESRQLKSTFHSNCSFVLLELKQDEKALEHANKAIRLYPTWVKGYFRAARAYESLGNLEEATQVMWQAATKATGALAEMYRSDFRRLVTKAQENHHRRTVE